MKTIFLLEKKENSIVERFRFQEREADIYTLLADLSDTGNDFSIELTDDETVTSYGLEAPDSSVNINLPVSLRKDGASFHLSLRNSGVHYFQLDMSDESGPVLMVQEEDEQQEVQGTGLDHFLNSRLPVTFEIGNTEMLIHDVLSLNMGSVIQLHRLVGQALDVYVGEELVAKAEVVVMPDDTFAARVMKVLPIAEQMSKRFNFETGAEK